MLMLMSRVFSLAYAYVMLMLMLCLCASENQPLVELYHDIGSSLNPQYVGDSCVLSHFS